MLALGAALGWWLRGGAVREAEASTARVIAEHREAVALADARASALARAAEREAARSQERLTEAVERVRYRTREVVREIPVYLPADAATLLACGFVRGHDAAVAAACPAAGVAPAPCETPGDSSAVTDADALPVLAENYGAYAECVAKLEEWARFYGNVRAQWAGQPPP